jgi:hypothetical protein
LKKSTLFAIGKVAILIKDKRIMKAYHVRGSRHCAIVFSEKETEDEARRLTVESGQIQEWEKEIVGEFLVEEVPLPESWELRRKKTQIL